VIRSTPLRIESPSARLERLEAIGIKAAMGRRALGCDLAEGGTETIAACPTPR
jgi:hypothetical protein